MIYLLGGIYKTKMFSYSDLFILILMCTNISAIRKYDRNEMIKLREGVREMFQHAYDGYLKHASNYDELRPLSCDGIDTWGSYSLTLIDALDTLAVMGNHTEFRRVVDIIIKKADFNADINVSVFETTIRIVGGLISAHLMSLRAGVVVEPGWPCSGPLLRLAEDVAKRILPAFDTPTGMPYGTVNLRRGVPVGETSVTCTAGVGTFIVEFGALSRLTGDPIYEEVAMNALYALYKHRSPIGLFGNHIDVLTGRWTAQDAGIGAGVDSYYEYLVKGSIMLQRPELMHMFNEGRAAIDKYLRRDDWHVWVSMNKGQVTIPVFQSLEAYWPGVLSLIGDTKAAMRSIHNYHSVWKQYGFTPEFFNIASGEASANRESYPLRPELIESIMYLYRATGDPYLLQAGEDILKSIQHSAKTPCGFATIKDVRDHRREDRMESFFLAETTKYLYLLFDPDNFLHSKGQKGQLIKTPGGECVIDTGGYVFNTEAHPIDIAALHCCHDVPQQNLLKDFRKNLKLFQGNHIANKQTNQEATNKENNVLPEELNKPKADQNIKITLEPEKLEPPPVDKTESPPLHDDALISIIERGIGDGKEKQKYKKTQKLSLQTTKNEAGENVEIIRLSSELDVDTTSITDIKNQEKAAETGFIDDILNATPQMSKMNLDKELFREQLNKNENKRNETNENSILSEFVQNLLKSTLPPRPKFDPQVLLEKIKGNKMSRNITWENNFYLLTCRAQPFSQRISLLGEFYKK